MLFSADAWAGLFSLLGCVGVVVVVFVVSSGGGGFLSLNYPESDGLDDIDNDNSHANAPSNEKDRYSKRHESDRSPSSRAAGKLTNKEDNYILFRINCSNITPCSSWKADLRRPEYRPQLLTLKSWGV